MYNGACDMYNGACIPSCSHSAPAHSRTLKLLVGQSKMASTPSQLQSIRIAEDWADLKLAQELLITHNLLGALLFALVEREQLWLDHWVKSCLITSPTLLRGHLLYMIIHLSSSVMLWGSASFRCAERVVKATVTADQTNFFPLLRKQDTVSHPLFVWNITIAFDFSTCRLFAITWM